MRIKILRKKQANEQSNDKTAEMNEKLLIDTVEEILSNRLSKKEQFFGKGVRSAFSVVKKKEPKTFSL